MKLNCQYEPVDMGSEIIAVPVGEGAEKVKGVVKLNKSAYEIFVQLTEETSLDGIIKQLSQRYDDSSDTIAEHVQNVLSILRQANLIDE